MFKISVVDDYMVKPIDLDELLCECLLQYENVWERAGIEIDTDTADNIKVRADEELLSLVRNNLFWPA